MGYQVEYPRIRKVRRAEKRFARLPALTVLSFLLFLMLVKNTWPEGDAVLRRLVFPGDVGVTTVALETLSKELRAGEPLRDALQTFCSKILMESSVAAG